MPWKRVCPGPPQANATSAEFNRHRAKFSPMSTNASPSSTKLEVNSTGFTQIRPLQYHHHNINNINTSKEIIIARRQPTKHQVQPISVSTDLGESRPKTVQICPRDFGRVRPNSARKRPTQCDRFRPISANCGTRSTRCEPSRAAEHHKMGQDPRCMGGRLNGSTRSKGLVAHP